MKLLNPNSLHVILLFTITLLCLQPTTSSFIPTNETDRWPSLNLKNPLIMVHAFNKITNFSFKERKIKKRVYHFLVPIYWIFSSQAWDLYRIYFEKSTTVACAFELELDHMPMKLLPETSGNSGIDNNPLGRSYSIMNYKCVKSSKQITQQQHAKQISSSIIFCNLISHWLLLFQWNQPQPKYLIIW